MRIAEALTKLDAADREVLARELPGQVQRELHAHALRMAVELAAPLLLSDRARALKLHAVLRRYATTRWRVERDQPRPSDARDAPVFEVLRLTGGEVLSERQLRRLLGVGPSAGAVMAHGNDYGLPDVKGERRDVDDHAAPQGPRRGGSAGSG